MQSTWLEVARVDTRAEAEDLALVLEAAGVRREIVRERDGHAVVVPWDDADRALVELVKYTAESSQRNAPAPAAVYPIARGRDAALVAAGALIAIYVAQITASFGFRWFADGAAVASAIRGGAWWRTLTALTLHGDAVHLAGNVVFGTLFGVMLAQSVGIGWTWLAFTLTGGLGNAANAYAQSPSHVAIGASTGVFGMLGVQVAYEWMRRRQLRHGTLRRWAPLIMGVALLAWLGGGGADAERLDVAIRKVDVGAHLFGFATGVALGGALGLAPRPLFPADRIQTVMALSAAALIALAWLLAFAA